MMTANLAKVGIANPFCQCWINPKGHSSFSSMSTPIIAWRSIALPSQVHRQYCLPGDIASPMLPARRHCFPKCRGGLSLVNQCCLPSNNCCVPLLNQWLWPKDISRNVVLLKVGLLEYNEASSSGELKPTLEDVG